MPLSPEDVQALVAAFDGADWDEMTVTIDGTRLALSRTGRPPTHADGGSPAPTSTAADGAPGGAPQAAAVSGAASRAAAGATPPPAPGGAQGATPAAAGAAPPPPAAAGAAPPPTSGAAAPAPAVSDVAPPAAGGGASAAGAPPASEPPGGHRVTAPSVGLFWRSPKPGAPPFVEVGDEVGPDDTVCIVEVMKLMNHVRAGTAGTVRAVHPENGQMVEHGDPLFTIGP